MDENDIHQNNRLNVITHELENQVKLLRQTLGGKATKGENTVSKDSHASDFNKTNSSHYVHGSKKIITKEEFLLHPPDSFEWVDQFGLKIIGKLLEVTDNLIRYLMQREEENLWNITCIFKKKTVESGAISSIRKLPHWRVIPIDVCRINSDLMVRIEADFAVFAFKYCFGIEVCTEEWS